MKNTVTKILSSTWPRLIFALLSGFAYYAVILRFILDHTKTGGHLLGFFFLPLIVCGAALIIIKTVRKCFEDGKESKATAIFWAHVVFMIIAAFIFTAGFIK